MLFFVVLFLDQLSKWFFRSHSYNIIDGFFWLSPSYNAGSAFGLFQWVPNWFFVLFSIVVLVGGIFVLRSWNLKLESWNSFIVYLFLSGISGNLIDRFFFGRVTDFIAFSFWPSFNIADSAMVVSVVLLLWFEFQKK